MSKFNLLKATYITKSEEARVIDSNAKIAERISYLQEIEDSYADDYGYDDDFSTDGFTEGLDATQVDMLFSDEGDNGDYGASNVVPSITQEQIDEMLQNANDEAVSIVNNANEEAQQIIENAKREAEQIMQDAAARGHEEGYNNGYNEALKIAEEAEQKCAARESELEAFYSRKIDELEPQFVDKLTDIYEQIFKTDLSDKKELVLFLISDAMRGIEGGKNFLIHVSSEDFAYVSENKEELMQGIPLTSSIEIVEDLTLSATQCFIEAESGIFDCGLGTELSLLKKELTLLSYKKE